MSLSSRAQALAGLAEGKTSFEVQAGEGPLTLKTGRRGTDQRRHSRPIYARDFKMVDQSDMNHPA